MQPSIHLVGSVGLEDAETVFRALATHVGERSPRYPDGETGKRGYWIRWQQHVLDDNPQFEKANASTEFAHFKDTVERPVYRVRADVSPSDLRLGSLGYAEEALASYAIFTRLKSEGIIPSSVRFQVSLPTPVAFVSGFIAQEHRSLVEQTYEQALQAEIDRMVAEIPNQEFAIQWDVCYEVVGHDGGFGLHYDKVLEGSLERLARLISSIPPSVELGVHLCYGDPGHKHIIEPQDTATCVKFANGMSAAVTRAVQWIHLPVPRGRDDSAYFVPLQSLQLQPETMLFLGLVHYTDGIDGTTRRMATAQQVIAQFGIATECGFGRRDPKTIPELLDMHSHLADSQD